MKKLRILTLALALLALTAAPAMARSTGIELDGKTYIICEDSDAAAPDGYACYEIDGKTFLIGETEVIVQQPGAPDEHLSLAKEAIEDATAAAEGTGDAATCVSEVTVIQSDAGTAESVAEDDDLSQEWSATDAAEYTPFAPYGLRCDPENGKLYYQGAPVRVFEDARPVDGGTAELSYFDKDGTVDVRTVRDAKGEPTGLEPLPESEFASRDLREWTNPEPPQMDCTATDGNEPTPTERAAFFAPYAPYGLRYDAEQDALYFNDRPVRNFLDVRQSNGESPTGGKFRGSMTQLQFDGELDVTILRDYTRPDANGEGKIIGVEVTEAK